MRCPAVPGGRAPREEELPAGPVLVDRAANDVPYLGNVLPFVDQEWALTGEYGLRICQHDGTLGGCIELQAARSAFRCRCRLANSLGPVQSDGRELRRVASAESGLRTGAGGLSAPSAPLVGGSGCTACDSIDGRPNDIPMLWPTIGGAGQSPAPGQWIMLGRQAYGDWRLVGADDNVIPFPGARARSGATPGFSAPDLSAFIAGLGVDAFAPEPPKLMRKRSMRLAYVVRLDLDGVLPPIWRRLRLASDLTLDQVHDIIQRAMGWQDCHLHHFVMGPDKRDLRRPHFLAPYDIEEGQEGVAEADVRLDQVLGKPGHRLFYEYDFGDGWWHTLKLEKVETWVDGDPDAHCIAGRRACPPEDIGGPGMVAAVGDWLAGDTEGYDPGWVRQVLDWLPEGYDPAAFSVNDVNAALGAGPQPGAGDLPPVLMQLVLRLGPLHFPALAGLLAAAAPDAPLSRAAADQAVRRYRFLMDLVGEGVALTQAGYLPPRLVAEVCEALDLDDAWIGKGNREDMTLPVRRLRESAMALGLVRKAKGRLTLTANGRRFSYCPATELLGYIASRIPTGKDHEKDAGILALLFTAAGRRWDRSGSDAAALMEALGWRLEGQAMDRAVLQWAGGTTAVLDGLCGRSGDADTRARVARELLRLAS